MKKCFCCATFTFLLSFCCLIPALSAFSQDQSYTIVFLNDGHTNPYHVEWLAGFEEAIDAYDKTFGRYKGYWRSASTIEEQYLQIEEEIEKGVDVLFVNAMSLDTIEPFIKKAHDNGIIWIAVHNNTESADYNFVLGDFDNGYNQGLALATYFNGEAIIGILLGKRANISGYNRHHGILTALNQFKNIHAILQEPADWSTSKALNIVDKWLTKYPELDAISAVTDTYLYPALQVAEEKGIEHIKFFGYDGDIAILKEMQTGEKIIATVLLGARREGWNFVQLAYKILNSYPVEKNYQFHTPLVLSKKVYHRCLQNGFPEDIEVYDIEKALYVSLHAEEQFGPESVKERIE